MICRAGYIFYADGRLEDAACHFEKAAALTETDLQALTMLVNCYTALVDPENAQRVAKVALGRAEKTVAQDRGNGYAMSVGVMALAALGESERAKDWIRRALLIDPDNLIMRYNIARALATSLSDPDAALGMLGPVLEQDSGWLLWDAKNDPSLAGLSEGPRFQAMIAEAEARLAAAEATATAAQ